MVDIASEVFEEILRYSQAPRYHYIDGDRYDALCRAIAGPNTLYKNPGMDGLPGVGEYKIGGAPTPGLVIGGVPIYPKD